MAVSKYDIELDLTAGSNTSHALVVSMIGANKKVLDVGCDTGYLGDYIKALGNVTWGFEVNPVSAEVARERYERVEVGDLEAVDLGEVFTGHLFDVIVFADVLEHLRDPLPTLRRARSMLTPGGSVIVSVPNVAHGDIRLNLLRGRFEYTDVGLLDDTHTRFFTSTSLERFVAEAGFAMIDLRRTRRPLFRTEVKVAREDFAPAVVAEIENDLEATTYQFVVRIVAEDATQVGSAQALLVDSLREDLHQQQRANARLQDRTAALSAQVAELSRRPVSAGPAARPAAGPISLPHRVVRRARKAWRRQRNAAR